MPSPRPFPWLEIAIGSAVVNALINAPLGWFLLAPGVRLPLWGLPSLAADMVAMASGVAFGTTLAVTIQTRKQYARGELLQPELAPLARRWFASWPEGVLPRAFNWSVLGVALFVPLPFACLWLFGVHGFERGAFTAFKAGFSFVEAGIIAPTVAAAALVPRATPASNP